MVKSFAERLKEMTPIEERHRRMKDMGPSCRKSWTKNGIHATGPVKAHEFVANEYNIYWFEQVGTEEQQAWFKKAQEQVARDGGDYPYYELPTPSFKI